MKYYGLNNTDQFIHENYINKPFINGSFLELGAIDGVKFSNTKFFEDNMGFNHGVLIEPDPQSFSELKRNRPKAECFNFAIHEFEKEADFLVSDQNAVGCLEKYSSIKFKSRWHQDSSAIKVPCQPLSSILKKSNLKYIDLWSLDVEGAESAVLCPDFAWKKFTFLMLSIERPPPDLNARLFRHGYTLSAPLPTRQPNALDD